MRLEVRQEMLNSQIHMMLVKLSVKLTEYASEHSPVGRQNASWYSERDVSRIEPPTS